MSKFAFSARDRADTFSVGEDGCTSRLRLMARSGGFVMVRRPRQKPFVLTENEWARLPLFDPLQPKTGDQS